MITKMEVFSENATAIEFPLSTSNDAPVQLRNIEGLGPVKAGVSASPYATNRGEFFQGSSTGARNIVLTLGLNPNWSDQTVASLRQMLYAYFMPEQWTKLRFFSDELPVVDIEGIVESFEPNIFSEDPEIQISVLCHIPDFVDPDVVTVHGVVSNALVDGEPIQTVIDYLGTAPTGFELRVKPTIYNETYVGRLVVAVQSPIAYEVFDVDPVTVGESIYWNWSREFKLSTVRTNRRVEAVIVDEAAGEEQGDRANLLRGMVGTSKWPEFKPGENTFSVATAESGMVWELIFNNRFGGL